MTAKKNKYTVTDQTVTRVTSAIAGVITVALCVWGIISFWTYYHYEETNDAQIQEYINPVIARAGGFIVKINFEENQEVKKGDTLIVIDSRESKIQQKQTSGSLQNAQAQLKVLQSNVYTLKRIAEAGKATIAAAKARLLKQQQDYTRTLKMYEAEAATKQQLENNKASLDIAQADYEAAQNNYQASVAKVGDVTTQQDVARADINRIQATLERSKLDVSYTVVTAPYNCRIGRRTIEQGQMIDPGQILAYIVNQESNKWVIANYKETQVAHLKIGEEAEIEADAYPGQTFSGRIISLSPATGSSFSISPPDNATGNYVKIVQRIPVRIQLTDSRATTAGLVAGMNVNVRLKKL
ncbi:membrane fusion protein, multidrug efflux system [Mucilaginibacter gossypiicola]|uniref:Membrane fusion protein, multidrug efflux system n=1 Tax=Mucilaginibacter gossypiicola TaxID=551995 RepID=A0A1H8M5T3_9SPHI|nr:HlyD family secretion protein [Mucilaginibacter gossypiicola]SEO12630.1 membrane fusion protein, multidrug efflux system [Mucilaginibacter gossypiicola]